MQCDGASPCSRCKADNAICVFGERKKAQDKIYPKGYVAVAMHYYYAASDLHRYVEMLEQQQTQLVAGLRELYSRLQGGQGWPGQPLHEAQSGHPLTHDILERLDLLHSTRDGNNNFEGFEEDCNRMQQKLLERGAPYTHRRGSVSSDSEHGHASTSSSYEGTPVTKSIPYSDPFARHTAPPTPPMNSPFPRQSQTMSPIKQEAPMVPYMDTGALDPSALSRSAWSGESMMMDEGMDYSNKGLYTFDSFNDFDSNAMMLDPLAINPVGPMMPDWNDTNELDFSNFINNPVGA